MTSERAHPDLPVAQLRPQRGPLWLWLIPLGAAAFAGYLGFQSWRHRGVEITVQLTSGFGLKPGFPSPQRRGGAYALSPG